MTLPRKIASAPAAPERRKPLTRQAFAALILEQMGRCHVCKARLKADAIVDEHLVPLDQGGSNDMSNRALLCRSCADAKSAKERAALAKGRRLRAETGQQRRRAMRRIGRKPPSFLTNRDAPFKRKLNGEVVRRPPKSARRRSGMAAGRTVNSSLKSM